MRLTTLLLLALTLAVAAACGGDNGPVSGTSDAGGVCEANPDPAPFDLVQVDEPEPEARIESPLTVTGRIAAFEAQFWVSVFDKGGDPIINYPGRAQAGQELSPFEETVPFTVPEDTPACLWVYERSARDGLPIHVVQIPLTLVPTEE